MFSAGFLLSHAETSRFECCPVRALLPWLPHIFFYLASGSHNRDLKTNMNMREMNLKLQKSLHCSNQYFTLSINQPESTSLSPAPVDCSYLFSHSTCTVPSDDGDTLKFKVILKQRIFDLRQKEEKKKSSSAFRAK